MPIAAPVLSGRHVRLEPLAPAHVPGLVAAANVDRSSYAFTPVPSDAASMDAYVTRLLADRDAGRVVPFAQIDAATGRPVGCTRLMEPRHWRRRPQPDEIEIGGTWLSARAQRTGINTEAKLLLMTHAFEQWDVWRVAICTDVRNTRSRDAIERLGVTFEGVLRNHRLRADTATPQPRDSALYSVTSVEWPALRGRLEASLASHSSA